MAAPNQQPAGSRPAPGRVHEHSPHKAGVPNKGAENGAAKGKGSGVAKHGAPKPSGNGKRNPLH